MKRMMKYAHCSDGQSHLTMQHRVIWNDQSSYFNASHLYSSFYSRFVLRFPFSKLNSLCNSWYTLRVAPNCDWHTFSNSVRVLLGQFCSSLLLR
ncbi:hypothetical protein T12_409 [Trichinella patagoniensis]|uniref:Uncharacterized protein n=1 Tax=Trichinella patagoniensis TaxID=990121 RepID=A0A0V0Z2F1_9BILA|nr:hypothetical protein T12_409 [Trichinella patagoniensis]